jgi:hypothetical protein
MLSSHLRLGLIFGWQKIPRWIITIKTFSLILPLSLNVKEAFRRWTLEWLHRDFSSLTLPRDHVLSVWPNKVCPIMAALRTTFCSSYTKQTRKSRQRSHWKQDADWNVSQIQTSTMSNFYIYCCPLSTINFKTNILIIFFTIETLSEESLNISLANFTEKEIRKSVSPILLRVGPSHIGILLSIIIIALSGKSRGSSDSIVSDYGLDDRCSITDRGRRFFV